MKRTKYLVHFSFFLASSLCFVLILPIFSINIEGVFRYHLDRIIIEKQTISFFDAMFGSSSFGLSAITIFQALLIIAIIVLSFLSLLKNDKWIKYSLMLVCLIMFCLTSSQNMIYASQYNMKTFNYLYEVKNKYPYIERIFIDSNLTKQAFYIDYGIGAYFILFISSLVFLLNFLIFVLPKQKNGSE